MATGSAPAIDVVMIGSGAGHNAHRPGEHSAPPPGERGGSPPTVLFLIHDLRRGGAERVFLNYVNNVVTMRAIAVLVRPIGELHDELAPDRSLYDLTRRIDQQVDSAPGTPHRLAPVTAQSVASGPDALSRIALLALIAKAWRLAALARRTNAPLVCTFLHKSNIIALTAKLLFLRRLRVVVNMHEMPGPCLRYHFRPLQRAVMRWFTRHGLPHADLIIAVGDGVKEDLVQGFGIPPSRIAVVHSPMDLARVRRLAAPPPELVLPGSGPLIVAVGRLVALKGFDILVRALAILPAALGARLAIVGDGDERASLEALIDSLDLRGSVTFVGLQTNPWQYMAQADVFALPSRTEAMPNVIIEAFALALPIVAADCSPGVRELLGDGAAGVLVRPNDANALATGIQHVLTDPGLRERLAALGPERASAFDLNDRVAHYEAVLRAVMH